MKFIQGYLIEYYSLFGNVESNYIFKINIVCTMQIYQTRGQYTHISAPKQRNELLKLNIDVIL